MGGNVFPGVNRRYELNEYLATYEKIKPILSLIASKHNLCPHIKDKTSFGDMDIVAVKNIDFEWSVDALKSIFCTEYVNRNGSCWSLVYEELQIDLIIAPETECDFTCFYQGSGDFCNFVGKLAHQLGLKFGHDGLWLPVRTSDSHVVGDILLTLDVQKALKFLDVKALPEYENVMQMFGIISASKYFNPELYKLENNNNIARTRDRKRPNYRLFLEYCDTLHGNDWFPRSRDKSVYLDMVFDEFDSRKEYDALFEQKMLRDRVAEKFNGDLVSFWTGEEGKDLGMIMKAFKDQFTLEEIDAMSEEQIQEKVKEVMSDMYS